MSAIRLPLLCAFAGGCLSNAVLFSLWRPAEGAGASAVEQRHRSLDVELAPPARAAINVAQASEPVAAAAADHGQGAANEAVPTQVASATESAGPTPAGSAVSDVLTRLEAAYRERVAPRAPASPAPERATAAAAEVSAVAAAEVPASVPTQPVVEVVPALAPVSAAAAAAIAPEVAPERTVAFQHAPPATQIHYGDVTQNTYITNVREGDVYQIQMQQLAVLQYLQLLGASPGFAAPARPRVAGAGHQRGALSSGITNPDNPWGFHFSPPNLVR